MAYSMRDGQNCQTFPVFSFKTNHRLLHPLVFALFFSKNPADEKTSKAELQEKLNKPVETSRFKQL